MFLAVRLHWRLGVVAALTICAVMAGLAFAQGFALEQTRRVAVACVSANLTSGGLPRAAPRSSWKPRSGNVAKLAISEPSD